MNNDLSNRRHPEHTELDEQNETFGGFPEPTSNYCKVPNALFKAFPRFTSKSELMVVLYVLRHTWGFQEFDEGKRITVDEFMNGRKHRDGSRFDDGIGMSAPAIRRGIEKAVEHGFLDVEIDDSDAARVEKFYTIRLSGGTKRSPGGTKRSSGGNETFHRTEKETKEINLQKEKENSSSHPDRPEYFSVFERNIGALTPLIIDRLNQYAANPQCPPEWIEWAIAEAVEANVYKAAYVYKCLDNWIAQGYSSRNRRQGGRPKKSTGNGYITEGVEY